MYQDDRMKLIIAAALCLCGLVAVSGCDSDSDGGAQDSASTVSDGTSDATSGADGADGDDPCSGGEGLRSAAFLGAGLTSPITEVACTLSDGTQTTCYQLVLAGAPTDHAVGPFCPRTITDTAEQVGIWIERSQVWDLDGSFITGLADFYQDDQWQLYDLATGQVNVTTTQAACEGAARPDVDPQYQNYCVECSLDYVDGGVSFTVLIPKVPVPRATPAEIGGQSSVGVALNGVRFDPPAPVQAILAAHTIAAFDDCGGHINLVNGYHYHAATGCSTAVTQCDAHAPLIGYALDGYAIHSMTGADGVEPSDLDTCRGHTDAARGYHYHAAAAGENMFIGCFHGQIVGTTGGGGGGGTEVIMCDATLTQRCCGDATCDGPETSTNCAADCP
jgi:hypothetical protein